MAGGLEKNLVLLANALQARSYRVHIVTFDRPGAQTFYAIDPGIKWHQCGVGKPHEALPIGEKLQTLKNLRNALKSAGRGAVVICFHHGILARVLAAGLGLGLKMVCSERHSLSIYRHIKARRDNLNFRLLALMRRITVQFPSYKNAYPAFLCSRITAISNPIMPAVRQANPGPAHDGRYTVLCVARLGYQKNLGVLIEAFAKLAADFPLWTLKLVGDGEDEADLRQQAQDLDLADRVVFLGKQEHVSDFLCQSHIFCLPSRWEGFPNALAEALAHGLPCIGFEACDGVRDLIRDGEAGFLAEGGNDPQALADALALLMKDESLRVHMGKKARISVEPYSPDAIFDQWESLIADVSKN